MARSVKEKIDAVKRKRQKAEEDLQRAKQEEERLIAPVRDRLTSVAHGAIDAFLRADLDRVERLRGRREDFAKGIEDLLARLAAGRPAPRGDPGHDGGHEPMDDDILTVDEIS